MRLSKIIDPTVPCRQLSSLCNYQIFEEVFLLFEVLPLLGQFKAVAEHDFGLFPGYLPQFALFLDLVDLPPQGGSVSNSPGSGPGSPDSRSNASPASGKHNPSQNQTQTTERLETRQSAPDKVNGRQANRVMENALGTLKQIREQTMDQARMGEKWQELPFDLIFGGTDDFKGVIKQ